MNVANVGGNMVVTNSNISGPNMLGGGIINNVNKQLPTLIGNNHHAAASHHPHAQVSISASIVFITELHVNNVWL